MKLHDHFLGLLHNTVNINPDRLRQLDDHTTALKRYLREDPGLSRAIRGFLPQGSWAHRTIIKPLPGREFDADILVQMKVQRAWSHNPQQYLLALYDALGRSSRYRTMVALKTRCVRVSYARECHVDLVPYVHENMYGWFDRHLIVNRQENRFEEVNPAGFSRWVSNQDRITRGNLRTTLRLLKYMRDYKATFDVPSVILTVLVGARVSRFLSFWSDSYRDLSTAFTTLVLSTDNWLQNHPELPRIPDPSCRDVSFEHRLNEQEYINFRDQFHSYAHKIMIAHYSTRRTGSITLWREIFGEGFIPPSA